MSDQRYTQASIPEALSDPGKVAELEALNGLKQFEVAVAIIEDGISKGTQYKLRLSIILHLHRIALDQISEYAGVFRPGSVEIAGSSHKPDGAYLVPEQVEELCEFVNDNWMKSPIYLAAYLLWRLNWVHPFIDGNGRTSRMISYVILCIKLGYRIPGKITIPDQIASNRQPYYDALEYCDAACKSGNLDLSMMETLLEGLLAKQLLSVINDAVR